MDQNEKCEPFISKTLKNVSQNLIYSQPLSLIAFQLMLVLYFSCWMWMVLHITVKVYHHFSAKFTTHFGSVIADVS
jgi:hypothetical protein